MKTDYAAIYQKIRADTGYKYGGGKVRGWRAIANLVQQTEPRRLLDYGSGLGAQYLSHRIHEQWGGLLPYCYDIGVPHFAEKPSGLFDGLICCDMLEHIEEADLDEVLDDIFRLVAKRRPPAKSFVFFHISTVPSKRTLTDGRNMHLTVQPSEWWRERLSKYRTKGLIISMQCRPE